MSIKEPSEEKGDFTGVDPLVSESLDSALGQLHLNELEESRTGVAPEATVEPAADGFSQFSSIPPSHMFPHPQMFGMGFIPYSQMMPLPHHTGFFPPPENGVNLAANSSGGPVMFNNSNDASVFAAPPVPSSNSFGVETTASAANDPLWAANAASQTVVDPLASTTNTLTTEFLPAKVSSATSASFRRQTFHALSPNEMVEPVLNKSSVADVTADSGLTDTVASGIVQSGISASGRAQSISVEKNKTNPLFGTADTSEKQDESKLTPGEDKNADSSNSYAAAYPYGGPLMQPNPVLSGHAPPGSSPAYGVPSPFHGAYGFASPFQFSGMASPNPQLAHYVSHNGDSTANDQLAPDGNDGSPGSGRPFEEPSSVAQPLPQGMPVSQHQQGGTPPPWMYGNHPFAMVPHPHAFSPGHPHMMHPNKGHQSENQENHNNRRSNNNNGHRTSRHGYYGGRKGNKNGNQYYQNGGHDLNKQRKMEDAARYADATLDQFIGNIYSLCKDQHGCRFLQRQLDILGREAADSIFEETKNHTVELMTDSFGNYLIQKLLERVTLEQRITLAKIAAPHFVYIASNPHGTRALQKLVECIDSKEEADITIESLKGSVVKLSKDLNGNHIVQKCLQKLQPRDVQFIFDAASKHCTEIATHRHGCCVLQRCLDHGDQEQRQALCQKLLTNVDHLTLDPFGNYVVQYIITKESESGDNFYTIKIVQALKPKVTELSLHKFGSNVIEKILRTPSVSDNLISELLGPRAEGDVQALLNDGYGNYVLQTMLDVTHQNNQYLHRSLVDIVRPLLVGPIRNTPHGRRIMGILRME